MPSALAIFAAALAERFGYLLRALAGSQRSVSSSFRHASLSMSDNAGQRVEKHGQKVFVGDPP